MFEKNKNQNQPASQPGAKMASDSDLGQQIHVMPERFYVAPKKSHLGIILIVGVGVLVIGGLIGAAVYLNYSLQQTQQPLVNQPTVNTNSVLVNQNENINLNQNANINGNLNANENVNVLGNNDFGTTTQTNANINSNTNAATDANVNTGQEVDSEISKTLPLSADRDHDQLTLAEESLYGTDLEKADTDGDGYLDGAEILSGYDPTKPKASLADSDLITEYKTTSYSTVYPSSWSIKSRDSQGKDVMFVAPSGEFIQVVIAENTGSLSLLAWYKEKFPQVEEKYIYQTKVGSFTAIRQINNQAYFLMAPADSSKIYTINYNTGSKTSLDFNTTFNLIIRNFKVL